MEQDRSKRYAESLEKTIQNTHHYLKKTVEDFKERCLMVSPEKSLPRDIVVDIRETYKEIRERLTEIKAIQQLLKGKYRQYVRSNPSRDKELAEIGFLAKTCYSKFEYTLMQIQAKQRVKDQERLRERGGSPKGSAAAPVQWFKSPENQEMFLQVFQVLRESNREGPPDLEKGERQERAPAPGGGQSVTLFAFQGDPDSLDQLQPQIQLRERDILERFSRDELRGVLTHLRAIGPSEMESILGRFTKGSQFSSLKCLLLRMESQERLTNQLLEKVKENLAGMAEGETRTFSI
jgi:hypothetical protein